MNTLRESGDSWLPEDEVFIKSRKNYERSSRFVIEKPSRPVEKI